jgi:hypothetical protein
MNPGTPIRGAQTAEKPNAAATSSKIVSGVGRCTTKGSSTKTGKSFRMPVRAR